MRKKFSRVGETPATRRGENIEGRQENVRIYGVGKRGTAFVEDLLVQGLELPATSTLNIETPESPTKFLSG